MGLHAGQKITEVPLDIVFIGSCTNSRLEDLRMAAQYVKGKHVAPTVRAMVVPGSMQVRRMAEEEGLADIFREAGATMIEPSCGACINAGPGVSTRPDQVVISAQNRNFPGRSGPGQMYLASPLTVAASAVAGYIVEYEPSEKKELVSA